MNGNTITNNSIKIDLKTQIRWMALYNAVAVQHPNAGIDEVVNYVNKVIYSNRQQLYERKH